MSDDDFNEKEYVIDNLSEEDVAKLVMKIVARKQSEYKPTKKQLALIHDMQEYSEYP